MCPRYQIVHESLSAQTCTCCVYLQTHVCMQTHTFKANEMWAKSISERHLAGVFFPTSWLLSRSFTPYPAVLLPKQLWWNFNRSIQCKANSVSLPRPQQTDNTVYSVLSYPVKVGQVTAQSELCQRMCKQLRTHPHNPCSHIQLHTPNYQHHMFTVMFTYCSLMSGIHADAHA